MDVDVDEIIRQARAERYACQSVARKALPKERVSMCLRLPNNRSNVQVWKHLKTNKSFYNGLLVCGSVWNCPVCAAKISERRKSELKQAFDLHKVNGGKIAMLTTTFSHKRNDRLIDTMKKFSAATLKFRSGKKYQKIREKMGLIGTIRDFEITYSDRNGFHPHTHFAMFYTNDVDLEEIEKELFELWRKACEKYGLTALQGIGLDLQGGESANEYLSKHGTWSLEQELAKSHIKKGKLESLTPFDFLRKYIETENERYIALFQEYAVALKGKTQLYWSRGLKKHFCIGDKSDEQLAKEKTEDADLLGLLTYDQWKIILKKDRRSRFLDYTEKFGFESAVKMLIDKKKESSSHEDSCFIDNTIIENIIT